MPGGISDPAPALFDQLVDAQLGFTLVVPVLFQLLVALGGSGVALARGDLEQSVEDQLSQPFSVAIRTASARDSAPSLPIAADR